MKALTHNGSNTEKLFENYIRSDVHNVGQVLSSLKELGREDAYKILQDSLPGMYITNIKVILFWSLVYHCPCQAFEYRTQVQTGSCVHQHYQTRKL